MNWVSTGEGGGGRGEGGGGRGEGGGGRGEGGGGSIEFTYSPRATTGLHIDDILPIRK